MAFLDKSHLVEHERTHENAKNVLLPTRTVRLSPSAYASDSKDYAFTDLIDAKRALLGKKFDGRPLSERKQGGGARSRSKTDWVLVEAVHLQAGDSYMDELPFDFLKESSYVHPKAFEAQIRRVKCLTLVCTCGRLSLAAFRTVCVQGQDEQGRFLFPEKVVVREVFVCVGHNGCESCELPGPKVPPVLLSFHVSISKQSKRGGCRVMLKREVVAEDPLTWNVYRLRAVLY